MKNFIRFLYHEKHIKYFTSKEFPQLDTIEKKKKNEKTICTFITKPLKLKRFTKVIMCKLNSKLREIFNHTFSNLSYDCLANQTSQNHKVIIR